MRISDWSSDVCSSDLAWIRYGLPAGLHAENLERFPADLYRILKQADRSGQWALWQWPGSPMPWGASVDIFHFDRLTRHALRQGGCHAWTKRTVENVIRRTHGTARVCHPDTNAPT